jgi:hypothetical protein
VLGDTPLLRGSCQAVERAEADLGDLNKRCQRSSGTLKGKELLALPSMGARSRVHYLVVFDCASDGFAAGAGCLGVRLGWVRMG